MGGQTAEGQSEPWLKDIRAERRWRARFCGQTRISIATPRNNSPTVLAKGIGGTLALILFITFVAGFVLDLVSVILIVVPIAIPIIKMSGFDPIPFCVLFLVMLQTS